MSGQPAKPCQRGSLRDNVHSAGEVEGLVAGDRYDFKLHDPVLNRTVDHGYDCEVMAGAIETY